MQPCLYCSMRKGNPQSASGGAGEKFNPEYLRVEIEQLRKFAADAGFPMTVYLLEMAEREVEALGDDGVQPTPPADDASE
jgi:hypothetical protein